MNTKKNQNWILPLLFLLGYIVAWGTILVDRQMVIEAQRQLKEETKQTRQELQIKKFMKEYNQEYFNAIDWNRYHILQKPEEELSGEQK